MTVLETSASRVEFRLARALYTESVLYKCFYWYGNDFEVVIDLPSEDQYSVALSPLNGELTADAIELLLSRIRRDLIDFKTRDIVARETQAIRELLVAKAFSHSDELDEPPTGGLADLGGASPRGFNART